MLLDIKEKFGFLHTKTYNEDISYMMLYSIIIMNSTVTRAGATC